MNFYPSARPAATTSHDRAAESVPADFNPGACPIISRHFFGIEPPRLDRPGPRVLAELLAKVAAERSITTGIERRAIDALSGG